MHQSWFTWCCCAYIWIAMSVTASVCILLKKSLHQLLLGSFGRTNIRLEASTIMLWFFTSFMDTLGSLPVPPEYLVLLCESCAILCTESNLLIYSALNLVSGEIWTHWPHWQWHQSLLVAVFHYMGLHTTEASILYMYINSTITGGKTA